MQQCKLSLFDRDDTKQAKSLIFIVVSSSKRLGKKKLLEPIIKAIVSNHKLT